ncbi:MAG TPA: hypothetical protein EYO76_08850, partial [Flavobacteriaceae bacterium]|nr:hypothetical protein [Flavobacteriaceae bacterium]
MEKLSENDIETRLLRLPEWEYYDNAIHAEFEFENFKVMLDFAHNPAGLK